MQLNYTVKGQGNKNIILLHGWGGSMESLSKLQDELAKTDDFRVYNIEWPGFGNSKLTEGRKLRFGDYTECLQSFIKSQKITQLTLVGHSFGGKVALDLVLKEPQLIEDLILVNSSGVKPKNTLKKTVLFLPTKLMGLVFSLPGLIKVKPFFRKAYYKAIVREGDYLKADLLEDTLKDVLKVNFDDKLPEIKTKTLLVWGEKDSYTPLWMGQKMANEIKDAKLEIVKDAKHNLPLVNPEIVATIIRLYLK